MTAGAHRAIFIGNEACQNSVKRWVARGSGHIRLNTNFLLSGSVSRRCSYLHRGHPPTCTLWASHYQHPSMAGISPSLFSSPLCLPSSFHLYSLHDDTPAMLSWQQSGPDCSVARQLTSPIRGTWRYKARDKQVTQNVCACKSKSLFSCLLMVSFARVMSLITNMMTEGGVGKVWKLKSVLKVHIIQKY